MTTREELSRRRVGGFGAIGTRETTDAEKRQRAREKVEAVARRGEMPRQHFSEDDLEWAGFKSPEIDALEQLAAKAQDEQARRRRRADTSRELRRETERVLADWDERERRERWERAHAEARRRLGLDEGGEA